MMTRMGAPVLTVAVEDVDVLVIGLGALGAAALHELAGRGTRVLGIDQFEPGHSLGSSHGRSRALRFLYHAPVVAARSWMPPKPGGAGRPSR